MKMKNVLALSVIFIVFSIKLFSYNLIVYNCSADPIDLERSPKAEIEASVDVKAALDDALKSAKKFLPKDCYDKIENKLKEKPLLVYIECHMEENACGQTMQYFNNPKMLWSIHLSYQNNWRGDGCGCLKSVILHELLHWGAKLREGDEISAYSCQLKCFPECTIIPKEYAEASPDKCCCEK